MKTAIDIKKPKYILPLLGLPFILMIYYFVYSEFGGTNTVESSLQVTEELNPNLPEPDLARTKELDKFGAYQDEFKKQKDYSGIQGFDVKDDDLHVESLYTDEELEAIAKQHQETAEKANHVKEMQRRFFERNGQREDDESLEGSYGNNGRSNLSQNNRQPRGQQLQDIQDYDALLRQIEVMDSLKNVLEGKIPSEKNQKGEDSKKIAEEEDEEEILEATKATSATAKHFNTITSDKGSSFITAILDEVQTVVDGSRIRVRLLDDIYIGEILFKKGSYLYGLVSGFTSQRVMVDINSIKHGQGIIKTKLTIYDDDGIKGLYVPNSDFREILKGAGGQLANQQISISNNSNDFEQFAYGALQDIYRSTTQAVSRKIKQNKAKLKYNTVVYLINEKDDK
ncbi:conjugative transposon protein TraM [Parabacteroides sp. PF5-9]|uniref:conjugative transposon protein TraM n=1 Tax=Parabacteroides sp. PF5-9 TaxID=1742404 RepID=UPI002475F187|nr:conjugative transposon protein TraM [Parabacteroides sp. PF5-9]MDH6358923.1 conjugative transposon TraM protein [Parabacteroides sp. PF5-9]